MVKSRDVIRRATKAPKMVQKAVVKLEKLVSAKADKKKVRQAAEQMKREMKAIAAAAADQARTDIRAAEDNLKQVKRDSLPILRAAPRVRKQK